MSTVKKRAIDKIVEKVNTGRPGTVTVFKRMTSTAADPTLMKENVVYASSPFELDEESAPKAGRTAPKITRDFTLTFECRARGDGVTPLDALSDDDVAWIISVLEASAEPGLWTDIEWLGGKLHLAQRDYPYTHYQVFLRVKSLSNTADLSTA